MTWALKQIGLASGTKPKDDLHNNSNKKNDFYEECLRQADKQFFQGDERGDYHATIGALKLRWKWCIWY